jgi:hypothetical protein
MIRQAFGEESMSRTHVFEWHAQFMAKSSQSQSQIKVRIIIFFDINGIVHKEFILVGQSIKSTYYCDIVWQLH